MKARQFVLRTHYSMYRRCPQRWRIATVATDTPPNLLPVQGLYRLTAILDCANFELTNHIAYHVENKSLISTPRKLIFTAGKLIFQVRDYT